GRSGPSLSPCPGRSDVVCSKPSEPAPSKRGNLAGRGKGALTRPAQEDQRGLLPLSVASAVAALALQGALAPAVEDAGVDIGLAANGGRVAKQGGDLAHDLHLLGGAFALHLGGLAEP